MAVAKNPNTGKWYSKFRYRDYTGAVVQKKKEGFATKKEALKWEQEFLATNEGKEQITFKQAFDKYLADCEKRIKSSSMRRKAYINQKHFQPLHGLLLADIKPETIRQWQNDILLAVDPNTGRMKYAKQTAKDINVHLGAFFNWAIKFCGLTQNPVRLAGTLTIKGLPEKEKQAKGRVWQKDDFENFVQHIKKEDRKIVFEILFWCGLRRGEAIGLRIKDVDTENKMLHVRQSRGLKEIGTPKTESSRRDVSIPDFLAKEIESYKQMIYKPKESDLLFPAVSIWVLDYDFRETQKKYDIQPRIRIHDLRHSHASMLINAGFSADVVADRLGHANAAMVLKIYGHMYPQKRVEVIDAINKIASAK